MPAQPTIKRTIKGPDGNVTHVESIADFGSFDPIDTHIKEHGNPSALIKAIRVRPETPLRLAKLLGNSKHKWRLQQAEEIRELSEKAKFDIETLPQYCVTPYVQLEKGVLKIGRWTSVLPWVGGPKAEGDRILCFQPFNMKARLMCQYRVVLLTIKGITRTVVVTEHVCDRIAERAGFKGNHVLFVAKSLLENARVIEVQANGVPLLSIFGFDPKTVIGYCPVSEIRCGLQQGRGQFFASGVESVLEDQERWRLKTFLLPEWFERTKEGRLLTNRASKRSQGVNVSERNDH